MLTKFKESDIPRLLSWIPDARFVMQWAGKNYTFEKLREHLIADIERSESNNAPPNLLFNFHSNDEQVIGHIQLPRIDYEEKIGRIGRVLIDEKYRGLGMGKKMMNEIIDKSFNKLNLKKLTLAVFDFNKSAYGLYQSLGFKQYNTLTQTYGAEEWSCYEMELESK